MRTILFSFLFVGFAFSQGVYLSKESAISVGSFYGRYGTDNKYGLTGSLSLLGAINFSFTRSSILNKENIDNWQNEYFLRFYVSKLEPIYPSVGIGYLHQQFNVELWRDFSLNIVREGVAFEGGLHLVGINEETRRIVASIYYLYFQPSEEIRTPELLSIENKLARSLLFNVDIIYFLNHFGVVIAPTFAVDSDFTNVFLGGSVNFIMRY